MYIFCFTILVLCRPNAAITTAHHEKHWLLWSTGASSTHAVTQTLHYVSTLTSKCAKMRLTKPSTPNRLGSRLKLFRGHVSTYC